VSMGCSLGGRTCGISSASGDGRGQAVGRTGMATTTRPRRAPDRLDEPRPADVFVFAEGGDGTQADRVYFSFTVLTTTGFGDFTAAQPVGRGLAVVEMLGGQLYLVTVIGILVGGLVTRRRL
jgi:hypothetical protein